ncbi:MAG TPA: glycosyltransferase family protein [Salinivirgaceae bacterium]|nr:glycosyltransferase family protein [Salinivirgaceae bacterium]HQA76490.1 glycosyltransferase family protein [Salinivirgaceae bacterium]
MAIKVLFAPLDWGMGHTTRVIALAEKLQKRDYEIIFALPKKQLFLLEGYSFKKIEVVGYNIKYYSHLTPIQSLIIQLPKIFLIFIRELFIAKKISKANAIDVIISDNRPFFRSRNSVSCYLSHQINLPIKGLIGRLINKIYTRIVNKFDYALIPDFPNSILAGKLSNSKNLKIKSFYCGPLSRFMSLNHKITDTKIKYNMVYIASGPQPYRNHLANKIIDTFSKSDGKYAVLGYVNHEKSTVYKNIDIYGHLNTEDFYNVVRCSKTIISLAGYTTIMDCIALSKPLIMLPTKNQWEQEYLAKHLSGKKGFYVIDKPEDIKNYVNLALEPFAQSFDISEIQIPETIFTAKSLQKIT